MADANTKLISGLQYSQAKTDVKNLGKSANVAYVLIYTHYAQKIELIIMSPNSKYALVLINTRNLFPFQLCFIYSEACFESTATVASERNQHCGAKRGCSSNSCSGMGFLVSPYLAGRGLGERCKLCHWGPGQSHSRILCSSGKALLQSAVVICKTLCNQLINLAYYCGGEKILLLPRFQQCASPHPCSRGSDAFELLPVLL